MPDLDPIPGCKQSYGKAERAALLEAFDSGRIARGPRVKAFEAALCSRLGASHGVVCSNGTTALELALRALGIGPGDEVLVPTLSWLASASAIRVLGAEPVFVDIDPVTHNVSPATVERAWTPRAKALIAVDMAGVPCDLEGLRSSADSHGAYLIEDAAHALGAAHANGLPVGGDGHAHATTFSFHPAKTITTGEGGLVTTPDPELADRMARMRSGGLTRDFEASRGSWDYLSEDLGSNLHMTELQAALGLAQLERMDELVARRQSAGLALMDGLAGVPGLLLPQHPSGSSWNLFLCEIENQTDREGLRDRVVQRLQRAGIGVHVHYPLLHRQPVFGATAYESELPSAVRYFDRTFTLPLFPDLTSAEIQRIVRETQAAIDAECAAPSH